MTLDRDVMSKGLPPVITQDAPSPESSTDHVAVGSSGSQLLSLVGGTRERRAAVGYHQDSPVSAPLQGEPQANPARLDRWISE